jgi:hypothetical protein
MLNQGALLAAFDLEAYPSGKRLLADERMQAVWKLLIDKGRQRDPREIERSLDDLPAAYRRETYTDNRTFDLAESAVASFFLAGAIIFTLGNKTARAHDIEREVSRWRAGAKLCREALVVQYPIVVDPDVAAALRLSTDYFERRASFIERTATSSPYLIGREARQRAPGRNENVRGQVRDLAIVAHKIFGSFLHAPVATTASVATGKTISVKSVENWSKASPNNKFSR